MKEAEGWDETQHKASEAYYSTSEALGSAMDTWSSCSTGDVAIDIVFPVVHGGVVALSL